MADPYASHLPVLRALLDTYPIRRVLEFGAGPYSTPLFLDSPLGELVSVEPDPEWQEKVGTGDERHVVVPSHDGPLDFDLILIDDGTCEAERNETIRRVLPDKPPLVVVHDAEVYRSTIFELARDRCLFISFLKPQTAIVWDERPDDHGAALVGAICVS